MCVCDIIAWHEWKGVADFFTQHLRAAEERAGEEINANNGQIVRARERRREGDPTQVDTAKSAIILAKANNSSRFLAWLKLSYAPTHTHTRKSHSHTHTHTVIAKGQRMLETFAV